jgi:hypothetical protein
MHRNRVGMDSRWERLANDPRIVVDLHRVCDGWCDACRFTERCLASRCLKEFARERLRRNTGAALANVSDALAFKRQLVLVENSARPEATRAYDHERTRRIDLKADEALAAAALDYASRSGRFVEDLAMSSSTKTLLAPPSAGAIVLRFHSTIYFKTMRALVGRALTASGASARAADADACAAQVLSCGVRSREALMRYPPGHERAGLILLLDEIEKGLAARFPAAVTWRERCLQLARSGLKATPTGTTAKIDIARAELARRR